MLFLILTVYIDSLPRRSPGRNELSDAFSDDGVVLKPPSKAGVDQTELGPVDHGLELGPPPVPAPQLSPALALPLAALLPTPPPPLPLPLLEPAPGVDPLTPQPPTLEEAACCCCCC